MKAVMVSPTAIGRLAIEETDVPTPLPNEAVVRVQAFSLNRGEVRRAQTADSGARIGWDLAGVVETGAADSSGPKAGTRVVGILRTGAWAESVTVGTDFLAPIPENVTLSQAATLPVAGLTALHALYKRGVLIGKNVLVTGATGGVGDFAIQLSKLSGATVTSHIRRAEQSEFVKTAGADHLAIGENLEAAKEYGPFDLVIESVGGEILGTALTLLAERGVCVSFGTSAGNSVTFDAQKFYPLGGASLYGLFLFDELKWTEAGAVGLTCLAKLVADGKLKPQISVEDDWINVGATAQSLLDRKYLGKAVLKVSP